MSLLPTFVVLKSVYNSKYLSKIISNEGNDRVPETFLRFDGEDIASPFAKFEIEVAEKNPEFVHIRSCRNNKYLVRENSSSLWIVAAANQPVEDVDSHLCTMFKPVQAKDKQADHFRFVHVQSGNYACLWRAAEPHTNGLFAGSSSIDRDLCDLYQVLDWESHVIFPEGVISLGPWGSRSGGEPWSYKATSGISEIIIRVGDNLNSISFKDANGYISGTFGGRSPNAQDRGEEKKITLDWPSEYLTSISGTYGHVIISLSFITNLTTYGPFGNKTTGTPFSIPIADSAVVGFHGRSGNYLDALGIYIKPVKPEGSISFGKWGGLGGSPFSFTVGSSWIKEITVHHGTNIKSLSFKDGNDHRYGTFGGKNPNDTGVETVIEFDGRSEFLTSISGTYGNYAGMTVITSLSFIANFNTYGPFGKETGTAFSLPIKGGVVVGFHGNSGHYIDSIGIDVKPAV